jgi:hypothetical protein
MQYSLINQILQQQKTVLKRKMLIWRYMSTSSKNDNQTQRPFDESKKSGFTKFLNKHGLSDEQATRTMYGIAIGAFLLSLFFWF